MIRGIVGRAVILACLMTSCLFACGCRKNSEPGGETVPSPPRELIEKSLRGGNAPTAKPGGSSGGTAPAPR